MPLYSSKTVQLVRGHLMMQSYILHIRKTLIRNNNISILGHAVKSKFNPVTCIPRNSHLFYYRGSLTTPGCYESVHWLIFRKVQKISPRTVSMHVD